MDPDVRLLLVYELQRTRIRQQAPSQPMTQATRRMAALRCGDYVDHAAHGTFTGYTKHRCRCLDCRAANAAHAARVRARQRAQRQQQRHHATA